MLYDNGLYDADDDDDEIEGLSSFLNEMTDLMANVQASEGTEKCESLEDLQKLFVSMFSADLAALGNAGPTASSNFDKKRDRGCSNYGTSFLDSYILEQNISSPQLYFNGNIGNEIDLNTSSSKKTRCNNNGLNPSAFG
ncbi:hypothetical protein KP509_1Z007300 [Ceratopteris richardii]|nr:hypothetical protein KP509_1Z007300 [Ceratopteris richardii]